jgi:hypothetical protein
VFGNYVIILGDYCIICPVYWFQTRQTSINPLMRLPAKTAIKTANYFFPVLLLPVENGQKQTPKVFNMDNPGLRKPQ